MNPSSNAICLKTLFLVILYFSLMPFLMSAQNKKLPKNATPEVTVNKGSYSESERELKEVIDILKQRYAMPSAVTDSDLNTAALQGIIHSLNPGVVLFDKKPTLTAEKAPISPRSEIIPDEIGYVYMADFDPESIKVLENAFTKLPVTAKGFVIDLRNSTGSDFKLAAGAASFFLGPERMLFKLKNAQNAVTRSYATATNPKSNLDIPLIILMNSSTGGAAEAFAHSLKEQNRAILIGEKTSGQAAIFTELPLKSGRWIKIATEMAVSAGDIPIFPTGIKPDIESVMEPATEKMILVESAKNNSIATWVIETDTRKRLTEASLVRNENPEIDQMIEESKKRDQKNTDPAPVTAPRDTTLQRAIDVIKGIQVLNAVQSSPKK